MTEKGEKILKLIKENKFFSILITIAVILTITGICLLSNVNMVCDTTIKRKMLNSVPVDYTLCKDDDDVLCRDSLLERKLCICDIDVHLKSPLKGDIILYYQLDSFENDILRILPNYTQSRDDRQLSGHLDSPPSPSCEPYAYNDSKPIAPCGAIADYMFTDDFTLSDPQLEIESRFVPLLKNMILLESEKKGFHNPPGNLSIAFQNFSRPKSWTKDIWELDIKNQTNNGFQNERFIAWMSAQNLSDPKPAWRLDQNSPNSNYLRYRDGLPAGDYILKIQYQYSPLRYNGTRKVIIASTAIEELVGPCEKSNKSYSGGVACIILAFIFPLIIVVSYVYRNKVYKGQEDPNAAPASKTNDKSDSPLQTEEASRKKEEDSDNDKTQETTAALH